jgi:hypothetical protein
MVHQTEFPIESGTCLMTWDKVRAYATGMAFGSGRYGNGRAHKEVMTMVKCICSEARALLLVALLANLLAWSPIRARLHTPDARTAANPVQMAAFGPAPWPMDTFDAASPGGEA